MARIGDIYADRGRMAEAAPYWTRMAEAHPGEADGYLQSATVFWDYFDFASASEQLRKARERLAQPALYGYQAGAIEESQGNLPGAIQEYVASSLGDKPSEESRERLLALARRPEWRAAVETETAGLLKQAAPSERGHRTAPGRAGCAATQRGPDAGVEASCCADRVLRRAGRRDRGGPRPFPA